MPVLLFHFNRLSTPQVASQKLTPSFSCQRCTIDDSLCGLLRQRLTIADCENYENNNALEKANVLKGKLFFYVYVALQSRMELSVPREHNIRLTLNKDDKSLCRLRSESALNIAWSNIFSLQNLL